jgi:hypothetical protein
MTLVMFNNLLILSTCYQIWVTYLTKSELGVNWKLTMMQVIMEAIMLV